MKNSELDGVIESLKMMASIEHFNKLKNFGIKQDTVLGVKIPYIRIIAKEIGQNADLASLLLATGIHEAKILASYIDNPQTLTLDKVEQYLNGFDSWDVCDQSVNLFFEAGFSDKLIVSLLSDNEVFRKRTAFVLMCINAVHNKSMTDNQFISYFEAIEQQAWDNRNFVCKAVNWALRQIGKRNMYLNEKAIECAERILLQNHKSAKWIASNALREFKDEKIILRIQIKEKRKKL